MRTVDSLSSSSQDKAENCCHQCWHTFALQCIADDFPCPSLLTNFVGCQHHKPATTFLSTFKTRLQHPTFQTLSLRWGWIAKKTISSALPAFYDQQHWFYSPPRALCWQSIGWPLLDIYCQGSLAFVGNSWHQWPSSASVFGVSKLTMIWKKAVCRARGLTEAIH